MQNLIVQVEELQCKLISETHSLLCEVKASTGNEWVPDLWNKDIKVDVDENESNWVSSETHFLLLEDPVITHLK